MNVRALEQASDRLPHIGSVAQTLDHERTLPSEACIHELVEEQAGRTPQAVAVVCEGRTLTYAELNRRANQLAHYLIAQRVGRDECVGVCMERSLEMVVALFGILKAGAAYLPLDPSHPAERLAYVVQDAAPRLVITQRHLKDLIQGSPALRALDDQWELIEGNATDNIDRSDLGLNADHLAYVMYTSGSTGRPKGVMCHHRGAVNRLQWARHRYPLGADDRVLQNTPFGFDVSVCEFFAALSAGARLVMARPDGHRDTAYLSELIARQQISVVHFVPSMLQALLEYDAPKSWRSLRRVFCSGEELSAALQRRFMALMPRTSLHNLYGPTEASIEATYHDCVPGDERDRVPIGRPIANVRIYVLDEQRRPVDPGITGEIHIAGIGVARGYLNRPDLTDERFLRDPFSADPRDRMYRTGDLGYWAPDGSLGFLGRNDSQVKIRGFRIELGEIEAQLARCRGIRTAAVAARTDSLGEIRLIAYFTGEATAERLRDQLQAVLPPYMVPSAYIRLESFPLTPSGKLDRGALPAPPERSSASQAYAEPQGPLEVMLAEVWSRVLGVRSIGRDDDFFALGGHSLLALRMISLLRHEHGVSLRLGDVLSRPVLRELVARLQSGVGSSATPIARVQRNGAIPLSLGQRGLWFVAHMQGAGAAYHVPLRLELRGELDEGALRRALQRIVERHEVLRTTFDVEQGEPMQHTSEAGQDGFSLRSVDLRTRENAAGELERVVADEVVLPFDLEHGPLMRGLLVRSADAEHTLLITLHHIVSDGWSLEVLLKELGALYGAYCRGGDDPLPELPIQYLDYTAWHRDWIDGGLLRTQGEYWKSKLAGAPPLLDLPWDRPRPSQQDYSGGSEAVVLDRELTSGLKALSQRHGATLFMTLLAAWAALLARLSGQSDIVVGTPVANRTRPESESLIGYFVNMMALRVLARDSLTFAELLAHVKDVTLAAQEHRDIPFERVVELVQPERSLAFSPIFQATFAWENAPATADMPGLHARVRPDDGYRVAEFDLTLFLRQTDNAISGRIAYASSLFDAGTVARYRECFLGILRALVADDTPEIGRLPWMEQPERRLVARASNATRAPSASSARAPGVFEPPRGEMERVLAGLWSQLLRIEKIGRNDNFFRLGGHSLLAVQMVMLLRKRGLHCSAQDFWTSPTLAEIAQRLESAPGSAVGSSATPIVKAQRNGAIPVSLAQRGLWLVAQMPGASAAYHVSLRLELRGELDEGALRRALERVVERHEVLRTTFAVEQGEPVQRIREPGQDGFKLRSMDLRARASSGEALERAVADEAMAPFDLERGPLMRGLLARSSDAEHTLLIALHHIVSDGWSLEVLLRELGALYGAFRRGADDPLPPLPIQYLDYAAWHRGWIEGEPLRTQGEYWKSRLAGAPALLELPWDRPRPGQQDYSGGSEELVLDRELTAGLKELSQRHGTTLFMTLLAGWVALLARLSGQSDIVVGAPVANRARPESEGLIGYFVNMLALRVLARDSLTFGELLAHVKDVALAAQRHQDIPFEQVVELVQPERSLAFSPIFQATFAWENAAATAELAGLQTRVRPDDGHRVAEFDLTLFLRETDHTISGRIAYASSLFDAPTVARYREYFLGILRALVADETQEMGRLSGIGEQERQRLPHTWNAARAPSESSPRASGVYEPPRGEMEQMLAGLWSQLLRVEKISRNDNFFRLGGHSLLAVQMVMLLRERHLHCSAQDFWTSPTLAEVAARLGSAGMIEPQVIPKADRTLPGVLSFSQQRLWFLAQLKGGSAAFHVPLRLELRGPLDEGALRRALARIVVRHEVLRTTFAVEQGEPVQHIREAGQDGFTLRSVDLRTREDAGKELERVIADEVMAPFDLEGGPAIRALLLRSSDAEHTLLITLHHIASDGWSMGVLLQELGALYAAYRRGEDDPLPQPPIQYLDYAAWHRGWIEGELLRTQGEYWKSTLAGAPALLELPGDRPRPSQQDYSGGLEEVVLDRQLTAGLKALSQRHGTTLFMTLLAAWVAVLARLSGQSDIVVGTPTANRARPETQGLIGCFVNALALRVKATGGLTFAELLAHTKHVTLAAQENQDIPFERVVELVQPERSLAFSPIFQVLFNWQPAEDTPPDLPGMSVALRTVDAYQVAKIDQTLYLREEAGRIVGGTAYARSLFDGATIRRHQGYLLEVLRAVVADDRCTIDRLPLLSATERSVLLYEHNQTPATFDHERPIHQLFEAQAAATPDAVAIAQNGQSLTYAQLNSRADELARRLIELGVQPEARVGICLRRSPAMVIAILGVLKAGGAFVPLDPTYPADRLAWMIQDSEPVAVLTDEATRPVAQKLGGALPLIDLDTTPDGAAAARTEPLRGAPTSSRHLAYVMYTSGSTGKPKGVMIEHRGFPNLVLWYVHQLQLTAGDCMLICTSLSFDLTQRNILGPLLVGARLCLAPEFFDPQTIVALMGREKVSVMNLTPSMLRALIDAGLDEGRTALRQVVLGGEVVRAADLLELREPRPRFMNVYGPTECTGVVAFHVLSTDLSRYRERSVPLGHILPHGRVYVLDSQRQPAPTGVTGEIHIGGIGVARGYRNRTELTEERFLADPFAVEPDARMYRTGDLGRWRADGDLEYLGRNDFQVKIRGFRIELGEIEAQLLRLPNISSALVIPHGDGAARQLIAYYTCGQEGEVASQTSAEQLRAALRQALPEYMVPGAYIELERLPLTPNGKIDRRALPLPNAEAYGKRDFELPESDIERLVARTWERLLKRGQVGRHDNFFELGGHSLLAMQLVSRLQEQDLGLSAVDLWTHPTVAELAECVRARGQLPLGNSAICINRGGRHPPLFFTHDGLTQLMYVPVVTRALPRDIPIYGLPAQPKEETRQKTLEEHAARMVRMIREVQPSGPYHLAGYSFGGMLAYEIATQLIAAGETVDFLCLLDTRCHVPGTSPFEHAMGDLTEDQQLLMFLRYEFFDYSDLAGVIGGIGSMDLPRYDFHSITRVLHQHSLMPKPYDKLTLPQLRHYLRCGLAFLNAKVRHSPKQLPIPVHVFASQDSLGADPLLHWGGVIPKDLIRVVGVSGTHFSMLLAPNAPQLGEKFAQTLATATANSLSSRELNAERQVDSRRETLSRASRHARRRAHMTLNGGAP